METADSDPRSSRNSNSPGGRHAGGAVTSTKSRQACLPESMTVTCLGLPCRLAKERDAWRIKNLEEVRFLAWAQSDLQAIKWIQAAVTTANAGLVDAEDIGLLLHQLEDVRERWTWMTDEGSKPIGELCFSSLCAAPAISFAAAHCNDPILDSWLAALLRTPLAENLTYGRLEFNLGGSVTRSLGHERWWIDANSSNSDPSWARTVECIQSMPPELWNRLCVHSNSIFHNLQKLEVPKSARHARQVPADPTIWQTRRWIHNLSNEDALLLACNLGTPSQTLRFIANNSSFTDEVRVCAARNRSLGPYPLARMSMTSSKPVREAVASHPNTTREVLLKLSQDRDLDVVLAALAHPRAREAMIRQVLGRLRQLTRDSRYRRYFLMRVAGTVTSAPKILTELSRHRHRYVRSAVLYNPSFPTAHIKRMATDRSLRVRQAVAHRPGVSRNILGVLARDPKWQVREAAAGNPGTLRRGLDLLSHDPVLAVRRAVARNERTPKGTLEALSRDSNHLARREVASNRATAARVLKSLVRRDNLIYEVAGNPAASPELLREIRDKRAYQTLRVRLALNPSTPLDLLHRLAEDPDKGVRHAVSHNPQQLSDELRAKVNKFNLHCPQWEDEPHFQS